MSEQIIEISNLYVDHTPTAQSLIKGIDLSIPKGSIVGVIGESGSGKSITMKSLMSILPVNTTARWDAYRFNGKEVQAKETLPISMIFQDPMTSLNPLRTIGYHLIEVIGRFRKLSGEQAYRLAVEELEKVGIPEPEKRMSQYPHELSGGMRQRVIIAMALVTQAELLIADEPTTALDVTIQAQILATIRRLKQEENLSVILVTHDFGVVAGMCERVVVMYQGRIVEEGTVDDIFYQAKHPYTKQLLAAAQLQDKHTPIVQITQKIEDKTIKPIQVSETHRVWLEVLTTNE